MQHVVNDRPVEDEVAALDGGLAVQAGQEFGLLRGAAADHVGDPHRLGLRDGRGRQGRAHAQDGETHALATFG